MGQSSILQLRHARALPALADPAHAHCHASDDDDNHPGFTSQWEYDAKAPGYPSFSQYGVNTPGFWSGSARGFPRLQFVCAHNMTDAWEDNAFMEEEREDVSS